jgi:hypothetical protein
VPFQLFISLVNQAAIGIVRRAIESGKSINDLSRGSELESLSDEVHEAWMKRNPKADYNLEQHVPYERLSEEEKQKDREHVLMAIRLLKNR